MFGRQDDNNNATIPSQSIDNAMSDDGQTTQVSPQQTWQHPGVPMDGNDLPSPQMPQDQPGDTSSLSNDNSPAPVQDLSEPALPAVGTPDPAPIGVPVSDDLIAIKQQALSELSPLVGHLEQSPEEKFRTTMMMIQASDNQALIKDAFEAAHQIEDEKVRAQALLDVVNEINYFTQNPTQPADVN